LVSCSLRVLGATFSGSIAVLLVESFLLWASSSKRCRDDA
jgi:hypothetical protein